MLEDLSILPQLTTIALLAFLLYIFFQICLPDSENLQLFILLCPECLGLLSLFCGAHLCLYDIPCVLQCRP